MLYFFSARTAVVYVEVLNLDAHEDVVVELRDVAVADLEVPDVPLLGLELVGVLAQLVAVDLVAGHVQRPPALLAVAVVERGASLRVGVRLQNGWRKNEFQIAILLFFKGERLPDRACFRFLSRFSTCDRAWLFRRAYLLPGVKPHR